MEVPRIFTTGKLFEHILPIPYSLRNDLMFKVVLQENPSALKELLAALLHIQSADIKEMTILNPYVFGQTVNNKTCIMDIRLLMNIKNHRIYTGNLMLNVLNLRQAEKATEEEHASGLYEWAKLFLAETWEELKQMAQEREYFKEALLTYQRMSSEEKMQLELE